MSVSFRRRFSEAMRSSCIEVCINLRLLHPFEVSFVMDFVDVSISDELKVESTPRCVLFFGKQKRTNPKQRE